MARKVGLYGGSFNPIHNGHLIVGRSVAETLGLDTVIILPSRTPPHKIEDRSLASADDRSTMVQLAINGESIFEFSDHDLTCDGPSYTLNTITHFRQKFGNDAELFWIIGADSLLELHTWYKVADLAASCRIVTPVRPGFDIGELTDLRKILDDATASQLAADVLETPNIDISATEVRRRVAAGQSIRYLVPDAVRKYIIVRGLYTDSPA